MTSNMLTKVLVDGIDITSVVTDYTFDKTFGDASNSMSLNCTASLNDLLTIDTGMSFVIYRGWTTSTDQKIFDGIVEQYQLNGGKITLAGKDRMGQLVKREANTIYDSSLDVWGGKISEIARDLIIRYGELYAGPLGSDDDTLALYAMQQDSGIMDLSYNGIDSVSVTALTQVLGLYGAANSFNGTTSEILFGSFDSLSVPQFTIEAFVNLTAAISAGTIMSNSKSGGGANSGWSFGNDGTGHITLKVASGSTTATATGSTALTAGTWYHVAGTYDGSTITVWINGVSDGTASLTGPASYSLVNYRIGSLDGATFFKGKIDDCRISSIVRTLPISWTDSVVDSGSSITLDNYRCFRTNVLERLKNLIDTLDYQTYFRADTGKAYFEPLGYTSNATTLVVAGDTANITEVPKWNFDNTEMANYITIIGYNAETNLVEDFSGDGATVDFTVTKKPSTVKVTVGGTVMSGGPFDTNGNVTEDYAVDVDTKTIVFAVAPGVGVNNVVIDYYALVPIPVTGSNPTSIATYGESRKAWTYSDIQSAADAQARLTNLLAKYSTPFVNTTLKVQGGIVQNLEVGQEVTVDDSVQNGITELVVINRYTIRYPSAYDELVVGDKEWRIAEWGAYVEEKIKRLQEQNQQDQDIVIETITMSKAMPTLALDSILIQTQADTNAGVFDHPNDSTNTFGRYENTKTKYDGTRAARSTIVSTTSSNTITNNGLDWAYRIVFDDTLTPLTRFKVGTGTTAAGATQTDLITPLTASEYSTYYTSTYKNFESFTFNTGTKKATWVGSLGEVYANGKAITELGDFNTDTVPIMFAREVTASNTKGSDKRWYITITYSAT